MAPLGHASLPMEAPRGTALPRRPLAAAGLRWSCGSLVPVLYPSSFSSTVVAPGDQLSVESPLLQGMACCHSLTLIGGEVKGDPLDCRMFQATKWVC